MSTPDGSTPEAPVRYERRGPIAVVTMDRPEFSNAQNSKMTYALDAAFYRAVDDDEVKVIVLAGAGKHFSAGHDIGSPGRDIDESFERKATLWWDHVGKEGGASRYARESEVYVGMCRRWREIPKPTIAMVQGACIAGGLMLAWSCDLVIASDDAFFADPVVRMGIPGVEYFAHPWQMGPRFAKEFLFLGERVGADLLRQARAQGLEAPAEQREVVGALVLAERERLTRTVRWLDDHELPLLAAALAPLLAAVPTPVVSPKESW